jgi:hypothetical protein
VSAFSETPIVPASEREGGADLCAQIETGEVPTLRGQMSTDDDMHAKWPIITFMTRCRVRLEEDQLVDARFLAPASIFSKAL